MTIKSAKNIAFGLRQISQGFATIADAIEDECEKKETAPAENRPAEGRQPAAAEQTETPAAGLPPVTREDVRARLAAKAAEDGGRHKAAVKALVGKYANGGTLRDIPEAAFPELLKELEAVT